MTKTTTAAAAASLLAVVAPHFARDASAQPTRVVDGGVMVKVPTRIIFSPSDGPAYRVETREIGPFPAGEAASHAPQLCPLMTEQKDHSLLEGFMVWNWKGEPVEKLPYGFPMSVSYNQNGQYFVNTSPTSESRSGEFTPRTNPPQMLPADFSIRHRLWDSVMVSYGVMPNPRAATFHLTYSIPLGLPAGVSSTDWNRITTVSRLLFETVLADNTGDVNLAVVFEPTNGPIGVTRLSFSPNTFNAVHTAFGTQADTQQEAEAVDFSDAFPLGTSVSCVWNSATTSVTQILVPNSINHQLPVTITPSNYDGAISLLDTLTWDTDASDGISAGTFDLERILLHETFHTLGFESQTDEDQSTRNQVGLMDIWRFNAAPINAGTFQTGSRWLKNNGTTVRPRMVCLLNDANHTFEMEFGQLGAGSYQGKHWKHQDPPTGIMDPAISAGQTRPQGGLVTNADWEALDAIGWKIDFPVPKPPPPPVLQSPAQAANVPLTPRIDWTTETGSNEVRISIYLNDTLTDANRVYSQGGLTGSTLPVPSGILVGGNTYGVVLTSTGDYGISPPTHQTFTAVTGLCDSGDINGDGDTGTDADIEAFFACIAGNCCAICGDADFNNDGDTGTDADIESFFRVLAGGAC